MIVSTKAIVLRSIRYGEADLIVKCYTASNGLKSYMLRSILKAKKGKLKAAMFQPLSQLEIVANHKDKGRLEYIKEAKISEINTSIISSVRKTSIAIFLAEIIQNAVQEEEANPSLFGFLENEIHCLETHGHTANFHLYFLVKFSKCLGIYPHAFSENANYFNLMEGHFQSSETGQYSIGGKNCELLKQFMGNIDTENDFSSLKLNQDMRKNFLSFILFYYELQLQGFKKPKSLEVLNQLF